MSDDTANLIGKEKTVDEWIDMAKQLRDAGVLFLSITGGEPTVFPGFCELYKSLYRMGFMITLRTNGTHFTDDIRRTLLEYPPHLVSITVYGASDLTYSRLSGRELVVVDSVKSAIQFLYSNNIDLHVTYTMVKSNIYDLPAVDSYIRKYVGIETGATSDIFPHVFSAAYNERIMNEALATAQRVCIRKNSPGDLEKALNEAIVVNRQAESFFSHINRPLGYYYKCQSDKVISKCLSSTTSCVIMWNGELQSCVENTYKKYRPFEIGFKNAWNEMQKDYDELFPELNDCKNCAYLDYCYNPCPARFYIETGSNSAPFIEYCKYAYMSKTYDELFGKNT